jgi:DNA topoisomerase-2
LYCRPDTYIGSVQPVTEQMWVYENDSMVLRDITYVPGFYKIFDEILVNAAGKEIQFRCSVPDLYGFCCSES